MYGKNDNLEPKAGKTQNFKMEIKFSFCLQFRFFSSLNLIGNRRNVDICGLACHTFQSHRNNFMQIHATPQALDLKT